MVVARVALALLVALLVTGGATAAPVGPSGPSLSVEPAFSPNGDGVKDVLRIGVTLALPAQLTVVVRAPDGTTAAIPVVAQAVAAGTTTVVWDGRLDTGGTAPDGLYDVVATARVADAGESVEATVRLDTRRPVLRWVNAPQRVGAGALTVGLRLIDEDASARVTLLVGERRSGALHASGARSLPTGSHRVRFTLRSPSGGSLPPGAYRYGLRAVDPAGNVASSSLRRLLREYPVSPRIVRRVEGAGKRVALTFDDCNDGGAWQQILQVLAARQAGATFFCLGSQIERHAAQARRTLRDGHSIGSHSWNHPLLTGLSAAAIRSDTERTTMVWWRLASVAPMPFYRPPYGGYDEEALRGIGAAGYRTVVLWDVDPQDWRRPGSSVIAARTTGPARSGSIVVLHALPQTAAALPAIIDGLRAKGLSPVTLDALVDAAG